MTVDADALLTWAGRYPELALLFNPSGSDKEFDDALESLIDEGVRWLEDNANNLRGQQEDALSTTLAGKISMPGLRVSRERNINGHVDMVFEIEYARPQRRWLAEAKRWDGPKYHVQGLEQLLGYLTGRERSAYVFDYVQKSNIGKKWRDLRSHLDSDLPCDQQCACMDGRARWSLETRHGHSSGVGVRVVHYGVNLGQ